MQKKKRRKRKKDATEKKAQKKKKTQKEKKVHFHSLLWLFDQSRDPQPLCRPKNRQAQESIFPSFDSSM